MHVDVVKFIENNEIDMGALSAISERKERQCRSEEERQHRIIEEERQRRSEEERQRCIEEEERQHRIKEEEERERRIEEEEERQRREEEERQPRIEEEERRRSGEEERKSLEEIITEMEIDTSLGAISPFISEGEEAMLDHVELLPPVFVEQVFPHPIHPPNSVMRENYSYVVKKDQPVDTEREDFIDFKISSTTTTTRGKDINLLKEAYEQNEFLGEDVITVEEEEEAVEFVPHSKKKRKKI